MKKVLLFLFLVTTNILCAQVANQPVNIEVCDDDEDGSFCVDLLFQNTSILGSQNPADFTITYHISQADADSNINLVPTTFCTTTNPQTIYVRLEDIASGMFDTTSFEVIVNAKPIIPQFSINLILCDDFTNIDGFATFDLSSNGFIIFAAQPDGGSFSTEYYETEADALAEMNPISNPTSYTNTEAIQEIYIRLTNINTGCTNVGFFYLFVDPVPILTQPTPMEYCDGTGNGFGPFLLSSKVDEILNGTNATISFHETVADAENNTNPLSNSYTNTTPYSQTIYVRAENSLNCYALTTLDLIVTSSCLPTSIIGGVFVCDDNDDGLVCIDLTFREGEALDGLDPNDVIISYYLDEIDALNETNVIANPITFCSTEAMNTVYIRIEEIATGNATATSFTLEGFFVQAVAPTPLEACDYDGDGLTSFELSTKIEEITGGNPDYAVNFYISQANADSEEYPLPLEIVNISNYQTVYARVELTTWPYNETNCHDIVPLELIATPTICPPIPEGLVYDVLTIPYQLYEVNVTTPTVNFDDYFTGAIDLSFNFDYFGETFDQITIGTNGVVSMNASLANNPSAWQIGQNQTLPNSNLFLSTIFGVYHDLDDSVAGSGSLGYAIIGEAPYRKMIVFFDEVNQFSPACSDPSTTQIVLYETLNIIDIQIKQKLACVSWNSGNAIMGIQNDVGNVAYFPQGRNGGVWDATNEGHRFYPQSNYENQHLVICDDNMDGFQEFDLSNFEAQILGDIPSGAIAYFNSEDDLLNATNPLPIAFTNTSNGQKIYARITDAATNEVTIKIIILAVIDCAIDIDSDGVSTMDEDVNQDGNLGNDDTDGDGIPDFVDEDDDGDYVLTNIELINTATGLPENGFLDTDEDLIPNHRDADDDGDGVLTIDEDYNGNNNPQDDDLNNNMIPDYLDNTVLSVQETTENSVLIYPNPVQEQLNIQAEANTQLTSLKIYSVDGKQVFQQQLTTERNSVTVDVHNFSAGFYILKIQTKNRGTLTKRFVVE